MQKKHFWFLGLGVVVLGLGGAVAAYFIINNSSTEALSVEEYAVLCRNMQQEFRNDITNEEYRAGIPKQHLQDIFKKHRDATRAVNAPELLEEYHSVFTEAFTGYHEWSQNLQDNEVVMAFEDDELLEFANNLRLEAQLALGELSPEIQTILVENGCIDASNLPRVNEGG